ncbi:type II secretion system protein GspM [Stenotrophomonas sp.]|uniref:type II secretion system protein GspM n=1 Tax=Stenotrophomonas sp. TaxID=69392 RepID=UPI0028B14219|nr:type II secretion system protein GspM [Stenotrophomonas sp.]
MGTAEISGGRGLRGLLGTRWAALAPRDRLALQVLLAFAVLLAFWFGAWMPTRHALQQARRDVAAEQQLQRHLRANAVRAGAAAQRGAALKASELPAMLSALADEQGLTIHQVQQRPEQRVAVSLEGAPAQALLWLQALQDRGLGVAELRLLQQPDGSWQGEAVLQGPAS